MTRVALNRRQFAAGLGGTIIAFSLSPTASAKKQARLPGSLDRNRRLDAWLSINADSTVTVFTGKVELGQGILTALAQIAAEELDIGIDRIAMIAGDTARTPDEGFTSGSRSIEQSGMALRYACAEARDLLIRLAAHRLDWSYDELTVQDGAVYAPGMHKVSFGELAAEVDLRRKATAQVRPKPAGARKVAGKSIARRDIPGKVTGAAAYVQDIRLPGMLHGRIVRPPRPHGVLDTFDEAGVKTLPGVTAVVRNGSFLGVIAEREEQAVRAREFLLRNSRWIGGDKLPDPGDLPGALLAGSSTASVVSEKGNAPTLGATTILEATYTKPYTAHASIGPSCALAQFKDGKLTVWTHSQGVFPLRRDLSRALKLDEDAIRCIHADSSGCYGHNGADDAALDAALLARATQGRPVRLQWMRDDEFAWEPYGPVMAMKAKASLAKGKIVDWRYDVWSNTHSTRPGRADGVDLLASWYLAQPFAPAPPHPGGGDRNAVPLYVFPSQRITSHFLREMPLRVSALRSLGAYANVFAVESFMDELALAAGADPVAFRLAHLKDKRARAVIAAAAKAAKWKRTKSDGRHGRGFAFARYKNATTYVAVVADIAVDRDTGRLRVPRCFAAADAGEIINPDGLTNQIEGGIVQATSWTLHEAVQYNADGIVSRDWLSYPILTMPEVPTLKTVLIDHPEEPPLGAGEAAQGPTAAAIANALAQATGKRLRDLPLTAARVKAVLI
jgi:CO/xanthine dehydrogenase Mo-binding subunit